MGVLAEAVKSMSGAEVTIGKVTFQLSPMLTLLLLNFSTQGCEAPGSRQPPHPHLLFFPFLFARGRLLVSSRRPAQHPIATRPLDPILAACDLLSLGTSRKT